MGPGGFSSLTAPGPLGQPSPGSLPLVPGITHQACPLHSAPLCASVPSSFSLLAPTLHPHVKSCLFARAHLIPRGHPFLTVLPKQLVFCLPSFSGSHQHHRLQCLYGMCVCVGVWVCPLTRLVPSVTGRHFKSPFLGKKKRVHSQDFLVVQWLRLHSPNAGSRGSIPGQGTRSLMPQLRPGSAK